MSSTWFLLLVVLLAIGSIIVGMVRNRRFRRKELLHRQLASKYQLQVAYLNERDFSLYGGYRGYPLRLEAMILRSPQEKDKDGQPVVKISLPMVNPTLKILRIVRPSEQHPKLSTHGQMDRPQVLRHEIAPWLDITTNDPMFTGLILSEDVKISLFDVFNRLESGLLLLQDEELSFLTPELLLDTAVIDRYDRIIALLCDMKDELQ